MSSPNTSSAQDDVLKGVSCVSSTFCIAVGDYYNGSKDQTLIEKRSGGAWSIVSSLSTSSSQNNVLYGVSCASTSFCMAAGYYSNGTNDQTLIETWNGSAWSVASSPNTSSSQDDILYAVSCFSSSFCMAVGDVYNGTNVQTLIERWSGSTWNIVASPNTSSSQDNFLYGVSCPTATFCVAAGNYNNGANDQTLIESWSGGAWSAVSSPNSSGTQDNDLSGVTCVSTSFCFAAGEYSNGTVQQTLIEKWNGTAWTRANSPNTSSTQRNVLGGPSCATSSFCMAAGYYFNGSHDQTLIERWNGNTWSRVTSPNTSSSQDNFLTAMDCVSSSFCMAAGIYVNSSMHFQTLIERW